MSATRPAAGPVAGGWAGSPGRAGLLAGVVGLVAAGATALATSVEGEQLALLVAAVAGAVAAWLALVRFGAFVIVLLVARSSLDAFGQGGLRGGALDPAAAVGGLLLVAGGLWLLARRGTADWVRPSGATAALAALAAVATISVASSAAPLASAEAALRLLSGVVMFAVLEQLLARRHDPRPYVLALYASLLVPALVGGWQAATGGGSTERSDVPRVFATFAHPNVFATYLVFVLLVATAVALRGRGRLRALSVPVALVSAVLLVLTYSRGGWITAVVGLTYLGLRLDRRVLVGLVGAVVLVVAVAPSTIERITDVTDPQEIPGDVPPNSLAWRVGYWGEVLELAEDRPFTGIGLEVVQRTASEGLQPHNVFVQALVELGLIGLVALLVAIVALGVVLARRPALAATDLDHALAHAAVAGGLALLVSLPSENVLTATVTWWYAALALTYGFRRSGAPPSHPADGGTDLITTEPGAPGAERAAGRTG